MREIKFRLWDSKNHKWFIKGEDGLVSNMVCCDSWDMFDPDDYVWCQYTGVKDKNGVEIYEGDVLFHPLQGRRKVFYPYSKTVASYGLRNIDNGFGSTLQDSHAVWKVIGNIYENPDLLEADK